MFNNKKVFIRSSKKLQYDTQKGIKKKVKEQKYKIGF